MKRTIYVILFLSVLFSYRLYSQAGFTVFNSHDSLLFDGANVNFTGNILSEFCPVNNDCYITVWNVSGTVIGTVIKDTIVESGCMETDTAWVCQRKQLSPGDRIKPGDTVTTGSDGFAELRIKYNKGTFFKTKNSLEGVARTDKVIIDSDSRLVPGCLTSLQRGRVWFHENTENLGNEVNDSYNKAIESVKSIIRPKGTKYSVAMTENGDLIKVYDGSVEVELRKFDDSEIKNNTEELQKLYQDYQSGKISQEEMIKRSKELSEKVQYGVNDFKMKITLTAGQMVLAGGKLSEVTQIPADDEQWWVK